MFPVCLLGIEKALALVTRVSRPCGLRLTHVWVGRCVCVCVLKAGRV